MAVVEELHPLSEADCWELLGHRRLGRLAVIIDGRPQIFPVNYAPVGRRLIFRSGPGSKVDAALGGPAAFEVDFHDESGGTGWSVLLQGAVEPVAEGEAGEPLRGVAVYPAAPGHRPLLFVFTPDTVSGRRFAWGGAVPPYP